MDSWMVPKVLRDVRLHLARTPPCSILDVLHYGRHRGLSRWCPFSILHVTARPATKDPVTALLLAGSSLHGGPQWKNRPTPHVPQPLLHCARRLHASLALYGLSGWCCKRSRSFGVYGRCDPCSEREIGTED